MYVDKIKELLVEKDVEFRTFEATLHFGSSLEPVRIQTNRISRDNISKEHLPQSAFQVGWGFLPSH